MGDEMKELATSRGKRPKIHTFENVGISDEALRHIGEDVYQVTINNTIGNSGVLDPALNNRARKALKKELQQVAAAIEKEETSARLEADIWNNKFEKNKAAQGIWRRRKLKPIQILPAKNQGRRRPKVGGLIPNRMESTCEMQKLLLQLEMN